jgi:ribonuclease T1
MINRLSPKLFKVFLHNLMVVLAFCCAAFGLMAPTQARDLPSQAIEQSQIISAELPKEAQQTLALIRRGGPFPYEKDGVAFGNREKQLPKQPRGYYTEYTVRTPGAKNRGARRLVVGGEPQTSKEIYYTDDHYQSFKRVKQVDK